MIVVIVMAFSSPLRIRIFKFLIWVSTLLDLLNNSQTDFMKMKHFRREDIKHILDILEIEKDFL